MGNRDRGVKSFSYTEEILEELERSLSRERLGTYLDATQGDRVEAIRLYAWNTAISAAFYGPLQGLEVALRNAMHGRLSERYGPAWYDNPDTGLDSGAQRRIGRAKFDLARNQYKNDPHRVVATLSLGFWVSLLGPGGHTDAGHKANYQMTLWRPVLREVFAHGPALNRKQAHRPLNALRALRNRIAHHEPIFTRELTVDHQLILDVAEWISPGTRAWIAYHSEVPAVIEAVGDAYDIR